MSYRVKWSPAAEDELADVWMNAPDPEVVRLAVEAVGRQLVRDPLGVGESRNLGNRIIIEGPVGIVYLIDHATSVVTVTSVGRFGRRPSP